MRHVVGREVKSLLVQLTWPERASSGKRRESGIVIVKDLFGSVPRGYVPLELSLQTCESICTRLDFKQPRSMTWSVACMQDCACTCCGYKLRICRRNARLFRNVSQEQHCLSVDSGNLAPLGYP